jgi:calcineurin-like phosphoesterase family protein
MNNVWFISDTHFGHKNILKYEAERRPFNSIEEHDEVLIQNWNSCVKKNDTIWHLGDVCFGANTLDRVIPRLNGVKRLVLGNHDCYPMDLYLKYFNKVFGVVYFKEFVLSHVPVHPNHVRVRYNLHGHLHSKSVGDGRYFNISVEHHNLKPINLDTVREELCQYMSINATGV